MPDMAIIVRGYPADIKPDMAFFTREEDFLFSCQCVIYLHMKMIAE
jgi:hypothetical protein